MKTSFLKIFALVAIVTFSSCKDSAKEVETKAAEDAAVAEATAIRFKTDTHKSTITWKGFKPTGSHSGTITLREGIFMAKDDVIESGNFIIDMTSIAVTDIPVEEEGRLNDNPIRENFIERIFTYHRWQSLIKSGITAKSLLNFHTEHKLTCKIR
mgnify:CR=1 FL=1